MKYGLMTFVFILVVGAAAFAMHASQPELELRYKITMNVQTPEGVKSGSAVRKIVIDKFQGFNPDKADFNSDIYGEAVVVDLGKKQLFGLLSWDTYNEVFYAFPFDGAPLSEAGIAYYKSLEAGKSAPLTNKDHWPKMVTFGDLDDPMSVESVDPEDLSRSFGEGVSLKNIQIEITDDRIEWGIKKYLPWIDEYRNKLFDGRRIHTTRAKNKLANSLGAGSFIVEEERE